MIYVKKEINRYLHLNLYMSEKDKPIFTPRSICQKREKPIFTPRSIYVKKEINQYLT